MKIKVSLLLLIITITLLINNTNTQSVCDLKTLKMELRQDLADNMMLDCSRVIEPPHDKEETENEKNLRLAAQWDTSCSAELDSGWKALLKKNYDVHQLVDSTGDPVEENFPDQADLCEMIRAVVAKNTFGINRLNMERLPSEWVDKIKCAGPIGDDDGPSICAANGSSPYQRENWTTFLNPSALKMGGKPQFKPKESNTDERDENMPYSDQRGKDQGIPKNPLLNDLLAFSKNDLENNEGELANMINKQLGRNEDGTVGPQKGKVDNPNEEKNKSTTSHIHVKMTPQSKFIKDTEYNPLQNTNLSFEIDEPKTCLVFYMLTFDLKENKKGDIFTKIKFNDIDKQESRQALGTLSKAGMTGGFIEAFNNPQEIKANIEHISSVDQSTGTDGEDTNTTLGMITMPLGAVAKHSMNTDVIDLYKTNGNFRPIENFEVNINNTKDKDAYYILMYNVALNLEGQGMFGTMGVLDNQTDLPETSIINGYNNFVGNHSASVVKLTKGSHSFSLKYRFERSKKNDSNDPIKFGSTEDKRFSQNLHIAELPEEAIVNKYKVNMAMSLASEGWSPFGLKATITIMEKQKTILLLYHVNLKVSGALFKVRVKINEKAIKKSVFATEKTKFASTSGYFARVLEKGTYKVDLEFKGNSKNAFNPAAANSKDKLGVMLDIIQLK